MKDNKNEKIKIISSVTLAIVALVWGTESSRTKFPERSLIAKA